MKSYYEMGICEECDKNGYNGFVQKKDNMFYCTDCVKRLEKEGKTEKEILLLAKKWQEDEWETLVQMTREQEYDYPDETRNLSELNGL